MKKLALLPLLIAAAPLQAQQGTAPQAGAGTPNMFLQFSSQVVINLDQGRAATVWDRSSASFKGSVTKERFVADISRKRQQTGAIIARSWVSVSRTSVSSGGRNAVPQPMIVVTFEDTTEKHETHNEIVQFTLESDNLWHLANYTY
jgi:hypothetical protein